ncbi:MAG: tryptophan--tRNA ligase [Thermoleophilia bacterium]|nr:tryptophan--tRNA ligase [Thermoleophilia bacterium]
MRPTGALHIGHLFGALGNWVRLQDEADCIFSVVDLHAITTAYEDPSRVVDDGLLMLADWMAVGVDPERSVVFRQSDVPGHSQLHLMLSMITPLSWLERVPTYKGQIEELGEHLSTYGFLGYPLLQTADIILYKATQVPVGQDQLPHLELAREVVRRFNHMYGRRVFPEPAARLADTPLILGTDGRKMSKSYGNSLTLGASDDEIATLTKGMVTDPQRVRRSDPGRPEVCNVFSYHKLFGAPPAEVDEIHEGCTTATLGCVDCKKRLCARVTDTIAPIRERRNALLADASALRDTLADGAARANAIAQPVLAEAEEAMGLRHGA